MREKPPLTSGEIVIFEADTGKNHEIERLLHEKKIPYRICFGSWEGMLNTSYIIWASQLKHILRSEFIAGQHYLMHVDPDGACHLLPHRSGDINSTYIGKWKLVDEKTARQRAGWTYDRETGQYFVAA